MFFKNRKLLKAAQTNDLDVFKECLDKNVSIEYLAHSLMHAASCGHVDIVKEIFNSPKADLLTADDKSEALRVVDLGRSEENAFEIIKVLINNDADINSRGGWNESTLSRVSKAGFKNITQFLIDQGARLDIKDCIGLTAWEGSKGKARECFPEYPAYRAKQQKNKEDKRLKKEKKQQEVTNQEVFEKDGKLWMPVKKTGVSYTENYEDLNRSICEIFNFQTKQVLTIIQNTKTNAESHSKEYFAQYADQDRLSRACDVANENGQNVDKAVILNLELKMTNGHLGQKMKIKVAK